MLSQPMAGESEAEIIATREQVIRVFKERGYEVVNTLFTDEWYSDKAMEERGVVNIPLCFLAKSLENMSKCHAATSAVAGNRQGGVRLNTPQR